MIYERGLGLKQNSQKAAYWYQKAAEKGDPAAAGRLAILYSKGEGVPKDALKSQALFRKARNSKVAAYGAALLSCAGPDNCPPLALEPLQAAATQSYETDFWPAPDSKDRYYPVKMLTPGLPEAQYALAQYLLAVSSDVAGAIRLHQLAAEQGYGPSFTKLAALYYEDGSARRLAEACTALSVIAQDRTAGQPSPMPGLANYCNYLLLSSQQGQGAPPQSALLELQAAVSSCSDGACPPSFRELVSSKLADWSRIGSAPAPKPAQPRVAPQVQPGGGVTLVLLLSATAAGLGTILLLSLARTKTRESKLRRELEQAGAGLRKALEEMKRDGIEPPRKPEKDCGPDEKRLWSTLDTLAKSYSALGGSPSVFSAAELRMFYHASEDKKALLSWAAARLTGKTALELAVRLFRDGAQEAAALVGRRVFAEHADDGQACDEAFALLVKSGAAEAFIAANAVAGAENAFYSAFGGALARAGLKKQAFRFYSLKPQHELDKPQSWEFFRLCIAEGEFFKAAQILERMEISPEKTGELREAADLAREHGHGALANRILLLLNGNPQ